MPTKRTPLARARRRFPAAIERLISGEALEWSDENWHELIGAVHFADYKLSVSERNRARQFLADWWPQYVEHLAQEHAGR